ncbi:MAG: hypothetical protein COU11_02550 [Candidatus Harrisonbacteria bacterium CG10_big_fil_rev_8_21_14_0_10_49_15]|uniref:Thioredoxin domain-containing protein n=1 Tax=Candidatus Harrisonbacteria bacterium CG10_big_fil_rev_8_21_14_0_10_49_15 TaxID=1974587 RepID=A0A2H0UN41_9BACT|nr:MAG: hypothetical protein COU11_02550 [Candidatus Harrisonbacteria bacterium CG10_big_fil_rev_8_21_14_0_10_49_15]
MDNNEQLSKKEQYDQQKASKEQSRDSARTARKSKSVLIWTMGIIVIIGAIVAIAMLSGGNSQTPNNALTDAINEQDQVKGNRDAQLLLVEYSDFQCPACAFYAPIVEELADIYGDRIAFVYRHFPLMSIHPNARPAAWASEAAGQQGKFWEMHDLIFANQNKWATNPRAEDLFTEYAESLGLDTTQFTSDYESEAVRNKVATDINSGQRARITGTPTFFINGQQISNPRSLDTFKLLIDGALQIIKENNSDNDNATTTTDQNS